jgi:hypothetical protein
MRPLPARPVHVREARTSRAAASSRGHRVSLVELDQFEDVRAE